MDRIGPPAQSAPAGPPLRLRCAHPPKAANFCAPEGAPREKSAATNRSFSSKLSTNAIVKNRRCRSRQMSRTAASGCARTVSNRRAVLAPPNKLVDICQCSAGRSGAQVSELNILPHSLGTSSLHPSLRPVLPRLEPYLPFLAGIRRSSRRPDSLGVQSFRPVARFAPDPPATAALHAYFEKGIGLKQPMAASSRTRAPDLISPLTDSHGRVIHDLRVSITDRWNYKCVYCRTGEMGAQFPELGIDEYLRMIGIFVSLGITSTIDGRRATPAPRDCGVG